MPKMPGRRARGIKGGSSARGWGVWQSFFRGAAFHRARILESLRPSVRSSVPSIVSSVRLTCRRSRSSRSQVEAWPSSAAWPSQIALVISTDTEDANGEIEGGTTSPPHLSRRPWLSSARASPSRTRERLDGRTTRPTSSRSRRIRPTSAFNRTDAESTAEVYERVMDVLRAVSDEGAGCARFGRVRRAEAARIKEHFGRERLWNGSTAAKTHQPLVNARSRSVLISFSL